MHIECRRWFDRKAVNTYYSVRLYDGNEERLIIPFAYGYGEQCLTGACDFIREEYNRENGQNYTCDSVGSSTVFIREILGATYSITDVARKKDL